MKNRVRTIDYLKTMAIIAVVFFHVGLLNNGYLGVEIFFVISGYLFIRGNKNKLEDGTFNPIKVSIKKLSDFWLLIVIVGVICLVIGYVRMLPDDYKVLAESVVASNVFANNILQAFLRKNYWDIVNIYKPLMHTWYIGILLQTFIFLSVILWAAGKALKRNLSCNILILLSVISFMLFVLPMFSAYDKFYYFPFRMFEIAMGGILALLPEPKLKEKTLQLLGNIGIIILSFSLFAGWNIENTIGILLTVCTTCLVLYTHSNINEDYGINDKIYSVVSLPGKYSYDIYIWHQVVIAFLYYFVFQKLNTLLVLLVSIISAVLSMITVTLREKCSILKNVKFRIVLSFVLMIVSCTVSMYVYLNAGVVRSIPELGIDFDNVHKNMHTEYVDIPYSWDRDFEDNSKIHVLVIGNSFGRDFANILNESDFSDQLEISYMTLDNIPVENDRIEEADLVFFATNQWEHSAWITTIVDSKKLYMVGNKMFGNSYGIIYFNKNKDWYYDQTVELSEDFILNNNAMKGIYGDHYIDMISPLMTGNRISVFTDDNFYISYDCSHLTQYGARYYSRVLDLSFIINEHAL